MLSLETCKEHHMTRELSGKAAAQLLKKAFADKGVKLPHTQALDIVARLKGFEAWSHLRQAASRATRVQPPRPQPLSLEQVLRNHYGNWGEAPRFPKVDWQYQVTNGDTTLGYWAWVASQIVVHEVWVEPEFFEPPQATEVTLPDGRKTTWTIEANLTDRWGDLNYFAENSKPGLALLELDESLLTELRGLMWDGITFVSRKDGKFGLLFEVEYASRESESENFNGNKDELQEYKPHAEVVASLLEGLRKLQQEFDVEMCVPNSGVIICGRPAVWAFLPIDTPLSADEREKLGTALLSL
jgi:hypothetical protein